MQIVSLHSNEQPCANFSGWLTKKESTPNQDAGLLGQIDLTDVSPAPHAVPKDKVTFKIDTKGILRAGTLEKGTGTNLTRPTKACMQRVHGL